MEQNINLGITLVLIVLELILYFILFASVLPKLLRIRCTLKESLDRGVKKYSYPGGRGITYEPHPRFRKYVTCYSLYTKNGFKYVKCKTDDKVREIKYSVVMFDRRNKVIDMICVNERHIANGRTSDTRLHHNTSYVSVIPETVNSVRVSDGSIACCKVFSLIAYSVLAAALTFFEMVFFKEMLATYDSSWLKLGLVGPLGITNMILPSALIGGLLGISVYIHHLSKGIRWTL